MKKSFIGLGFGVALALLMLACMVSGPAQEETAPPPAPIPVCALQSGRAAPLLETAFQRESLPDRQEAVLPQLGQKAPYGAGTDENETPPLRQPYRRANFRAFHYPDEAG